MLKKIKLHYFSLNLLKVYWKVFLKTTKNYLSSATTKKFFGTRKKMVECEHVDRAGGPLCWTHALLCPRPQVAPHCPGPAWATAPHSHWGGSPAICPLPLGLSLTPFSELLPWLPPSSPLSPSRPNLPHHLHQSFSFFSLDFHHKLQLWAQL